jgi:hypothetical protein
MIGVPVAIVLGAFVRWLYETAYRSKCRHQRTMWSTIWPMTA